MYVFQYHHLDLSVLAISDVHHRVERISQVMLPVAVAIVVVTFSTLLIILRFSLTTNKVSLNINGKYVLITGCDSGIGRETAIRLDKMGVRVLATCLTKEGEQSLKSVTSDKLKTFQMNVTNSQQIEEVFQKVKELLDGKSGKQKSFIR